jgi:ribosomal protein S13
MGMKSFLIKKALQAKGVSKEQAELIAEKLASDPTMADKLKKLEENKELKALFETIQKEMEEKKKAGMPEQYAMMAVMTKHKDMIAKHRDDLAPLMELMTGLQQ